MKIIEHLKTTPLFQGLTCEDLEDLAMILTDQEFKRGQTIFSEGDAGLGFYVVVSGVVKIYKLSLDGKEQILHIFEAGEPFAEAAVFSGASFPAHAMALNDSRVFFFPRTSFIELIKVRPTLAMNMMAALSMRLKKFAQLIEALSLKEVPSRLASHILYLSAQQEDADEVDLKIAKNHLASLLGTIPETLSRILTKMQKQGLIESAGSTITILDHDGLEDLAEGERRL
jgi:CRP/FNR family transcriptional regulator